MRPLLPVLLSFITGILIYARFTPSARLLYALFFLSLLLLALFYLRRPGAARYVSAVITSMPFLFLGAIFILPVVSPTVEKDHIVEYLRQSTGGFNRMSEGIKPVTVDFEALIAGRPEYGRGVTTVAVKAQRIKEGRGWIETTGLVRLKIRSELGTLKRGDRVRVRASLKEPYSFYNPGGYDYRQRLAADSIYVTGSVKHPALLVEVAEGKDTLLSSVDTIRAGLGAFIDKGGYANPGVIKALATGDKSGLSRSVKESFASTGTSHLLAISGLHVGTVAFISYALILLILKRSEYLLLALNVKKAAAIGSVIPAFIYASIAGFPLSTTRAIIMLALYVLAYTLGRGRLYLNVLALTAFLILLQNPSALFDISFQLSFSAVAGIILIAPRLTAYILPDRSDKSTKASAVTELLREKQGRVRQLLPVALRRIWRWAATALIISFAAALGTAPLVAFHFNSLSTVTLVANLLSVPLTGIVVPLLLVASLLAKVWAAPAFYLFLTADYLISILLFIVERLASLPWSSIRIATPSLTEVFFFYVLVLLLSGYKRGRWYGYATVAAALCLALSVSYPAVARRFGTELVVTFISVGQGDSALLELPGGETMLIDGGGFYNTDFDPGQFVVAPLLWRKKIRKIDYMVLSHAQRDHMGGLRFIAENFDVGEFWWNGVGSAGPLVDILRSRGTEIKVVTGSKSPVYPKGGKESAGKVTFKVFFPPEETGAEGPDRDINNSSLLLKAEYKDVSLLFTGDIEAGGEAEVLAGAGHGGLGSTVLKAPHHASATSSTRAFIEAVGPKVVVVSSGRYNPFGFPHAPVLKEYERVGARIYRTDMDGAVEVSTDGSTFRVRTYAP